MSIWHSNRPRLRGLPRPTAVPQSPKHDPPLVSLVCAARSGDHAAWTSLVRRFDRSLRAIARSYHLAPADIDDVVQATWLSMLEDIERVREPAAIAGWLATTTRRHAMRVLQKRARERLSDDPRLGERSVTDGPEEILLAAERRDVLAAALATLPERHRRLMTVLGTRPAVDYSHVSELLSMPLGSIGPTRTRALARLSRNHQLVALRDVSNERRQQTSDHTRADSTPM
jgi:RNA polymerase sigma factor (sigma-70 family)